MVPPVDEVEGFVSPEVIFTELGLKSGSSSGFPEFRRFGFSRAKDKTLRADTRCGGGRYSVLHRKPALVSVSYFPNWYLSGRLRT